MGAQGSVLVDKNIRALMQNGRIQAREEDVRACSLDLRVGEHIWQVNGMPSLAGGFHLESFLEHYMINDFSVMRFSGSKFTLNAGTIYLAELEGEFDLPRSVTGYVNPKSSAGRIDLHCIVIAEGGTEYNVIPRNYKGKLYMVIIPQSFYVRDVWEQDFVQLRFYDGRRRSLHGHELEMLQDKYKLVANVPTDDVRLEEDGIILHIDLATYKPPYLVGVRSTKPISVLARDLDPEHYFRYKKPDAQGRLFLEPGEFLLAVCKERLRIPPHVCSEMVAYREQQGEFRSHYAGFFDPGFGYGQSGQADPASAVCEIRNISQTPLVLCDGQAVAMLKYEYLFEIPEAAYGENKLVAKPSNYQSQDGVKLAKFFKPWPAQVSESVPIPSK